MATPRDSLRIGRMPIHFFTVAVIFFGAGVAATPFLVSRMVEFFYQPPILALVHTFTLGWITASMMGVMYRYVPALTRRPIAYPRTAMVQLALYIVGVIGMVSHFANGIWAGVWFSAAILIVSIALFAANMMPCLYPRLGRGVAETGMFLATCFLLVAASIGFVLALDKSLNFLGGDVLTNLAGHVQFAAVGWVTLTICAVSYRMLPAFLLPTMTLPRSAAWQLWALAGATLASGVTLLAGLPGAMLFSLAIVAAMLGYIATIARLVRARRMPIDSTARHAVAGIAWLVLALLSGVMLAAIGPQGAAGNRLAAAWGAMGLLGWISNFIIGMSYQLFPGFVARARSAAGWRAVTIAELSIRSLRGFVFVAYNLGVALMVAGLLVSSSALAQIGAAAVAVAGIIYCATTLWTLGFAYRRAVPHAADNPLRVLSAQ